MVGLSPCDDSLMTFLDSRILTRKGLLRRSTDAVGVAAQNRPSAAPSVAAEDLANESSRGASAAPSVAAEDLANESSRDASAAPSVAAEKLANESELANESSRDANADEVGLIRGSPLSYYRIVFG